MKIWRSILNLAFVCVLCIYSITSVIPEYVFAQTTEFQVSLQTKFLESFYVPDSVGRIYLKKQVPASNKPLIVLIPDAHANFEVQQNIQKILACISSKSELSSVMVEGAEGDVDVSFYSSFPLDDIRKNVVDEYVKKGKISGAESYVINAKKNPVLFGIDNERVYLEHAKLCSSLMLSQDKRNKFLHELNSQLSNAAESIFSDEMQRYVYLKRRYEREEDNFLDYIFYLYETAINNGADFSSFKSFEKLGELVKYRDMADISQVNYQTRRLVSNLLNTENFSDTNVEVLAKVEIDFKSRKISAYEYYLTLRRIAAQCNVLFSEYLCLNEYIKFLEVFSEIDGKRFEKDRKQIEKTIENIFLRTEKEKALFTFMDKVNHLALVFELKSVPGSVCVFSGQKMLGFDEIQDKLKRLGVAGRLNISKNEFEDFCSQCERFYALAEKRDKILAENAVKRVIKDQTPVSVIVAGGYHVDGITKVLDENGFSYMTVIPRISDNSGSILYEQLMKDNYTCFGVNEGIRGGTVAILSNLARYDSSLVDAAGRLNLQKAVFEDFAEALSKHKNRGFLVKKWSARAENDVIVSGKKYGFKFFEIQSLFNIFRLNKNLAFMAEALKKVVNEKPASTRKKISNARLLVEKSDFEGALDLIDEVIAGRCRISSLYNAIDTKVDILLKTKKVDAVKAFVSSAEVELFLSGLKKDAQKFLDAIQFCCEGQNNFNFKVCKKYLSADTLSLLASMIGDLTVDEFFLEAGDDWREMLEWVFSIPRIKGRWLTAIASVYINSGMYEDAARFLENTNTDAGIPQGVYLHAPKLYVDALSGLQGIDSVGFDGSGYDEKLETFITTKDAQFYDLIKNNCKPVLSNYAVRMYLYFIRSAVIYYSNINDVKKITYFADKAEEITELYPFYEDTYFLRDFFLRAYSATKNNEKIIETANRIIDVSPRNAGAYNFKARAYFFLGDYQQARELSEKAVEYDPSHFQNYFVYASALFRCNDFEKSLANLNIAIDLAKKLKLRMVNFYNLKMKIFVAMGNYAQIEVFLNSEESFALGDKREKYEKLLAKNFSRESGQTVSESQTFMEDKIMDQLFSFDMFKSVFNDKGSFRKQIVDNYQYEGAFWREFLGILRGVYNSREFSAEDYIREYDIKNIFMQSLLRTVADIFEGADKRSEDIFQLGSDLGALSMQYEYKSKKVLGQIGFYDTQFKMKTTVGRLKSNGPVLYAMVDPEISCQFQNFPEHRTVVLVADNPFTFGFLESARLTLKSKAKIEVKYFDPSNPFSIFDYNNYALIFLPAKMNCDQIDDWACRLPDLIDVSGKIILFAREGGVADGALYVPLTENLLNVNWDVDYSSLASGEFYLYRKLRADSDSADIDFDAMFDLANKYFKNGKVTGNKVFYDFSRKIYEKVIESGDSEELLLNAHFALGNLLMVKFLDYEASMNHLKAAESLLGNNIESRDAMIAIQNAQIVNSRKANNFEEAISKMIELRKFVASDKKVKITKIVTLNLSLLRILYEFVTSMPDFGVRKEQMLRLMEATIASCALDIKNAIGTAAKNNEAVSVLQTFRYIIMQYEVFVLYERGDFVSAFGKVKAILNFVPSEYASSNYLMIAKCAAELKENAALKEFIDKININDLELVDEKIDYYFLKVKYALAQKSSYDEALTVFEQHKDVFAQISGESRLSEYYVLLAEYNFKTLNYNKCLLNIRNALEELLPVKHGVLNGAGYSVCCELLKAVDVSSLSVLKQKRVIFLFQLLTQISLQDDDFYAARECFLVLFEKFNNFSDDIVKDYFGCMLFLISTAESYEIAVEYVNEIKEKFSANSGLRIDNFDAKLHIRYLEQVLLDGTGYVLRDFFVTTLCALQKTLQESKNNGCSKKKKGGKKKKINVVDFSAELDAVFEAVMPNIRFLSEVEVLECLTVLNGYKVFIKECLKHREVLNYFAKAERFLSVLTLLQNNFVEVLCHDKVVFEDGNNLVIKDILPGNLKLYEDYFRIRVDANMSIVVEEEADDLVFSFAHEIADFLIDENDGDLILQGDRQNTRSITELLPEFDVFINGLKNENTAKHASLGKKRDFVVVKDFKKSVIFDCIIALLEKEDKKIVHETIFALLKTCIANVSSAEFVTAALLDAAENNKAEYIMQNNSVLMLDCSLLTRLEDNIYEKIPFNYAKVIIFYPLNAKPDFNDIRAKFFGLFGQSAVKPVFAAYPDGMYDSVSFSCLDKFTDKNDRVIILNGNTTEFDQKMRDLTGIIVNNKYRVVEFEDIFTTFKFADILVDIKEVYDKELSIPERRVLTCEALRKLGYFLASYDELSKLGMLESDIMGGNLFFSGIVKTVEEHILASGKHEKMRVFA